MKESQNAHSTIHAVLPLDQRIAEAEQQRKTYKTAKPYPHIVIDGFLHDAVARKAMDAFPGVTDDGWIHYLHVNEKKHGLNKFDRLPRPLQDIIRVLNHPVFVSYLSNLTGIPALIPDKTLEGGGLHQTEKGGFLNIHADFTVHPHKRHWRRRVNLIIYLNDNWQEYYRGHLELWSTDMKKCVQKISPLLNRCVIFNTDADSFHGLPDPLNCPDGMTRKSIALYYYTKEQELPKMKATNYKARPGDGIRSVWIYLDKQAIALYTAIKGRFGLSDDWASKVLNMFRRK